MALVGFPVAQVITSQGNLPSSPPAGTLIYYGGTDQDKGMYVYDGTNWKRLSLGEEVT